MRQYYLERYGCLIAGILLLLVVIASMVAHFS